MVSRTARTASHNGTHAPGCHHLLYRRTHCCHRGGGAHRSWRITGGCPVGGFTHGSWPDGGGHRHQHTRAGRWVDGGGRRQWWPCGGQHCRHQHRQHPADSGVERVDHAAQGAAAQPETGFARDGGLGAGAAVDGVGRPAQPPRGRLDGGRIRALHHSHGAPEPA